ncbi:MAG: CDP-diacylglycerol--glycerol-3-phosphate 3-phosphatidyltransferase [Candidatus Nucleicultricaceae bacterium]
MITNLPNYLTFFRIAVIPIVVALFYTKNEVCYIIAGCLFALACITDFLDGYLARTYDQTTTLGSFLDPIADKLLVASTLLLLVGFSRIGGPSLIPALVILCREILVSGLREFLAQAEESMPVSYLAKWKTALQMISIGLLIGFGPTDQIISLYSLGIVGLWFAAILTLITGYDYLRKSYGTLNQ